MRISGGEAKGTKLKVPAGARPASERVRQAVFSSLAALVSGARVLDLYCGSGAYGLEALSRGARAAVFVDNDARAVAACRANVEAAGYGEASTIRRADAERYLGSQGARDGPFDLVFVDPPYGAPDEVEGLGGAVAGLLEPGGRAVVETRWAEGPVRATAPLIVEADRRYGDTRVLVFRLGER